MTMPVRAVVLYENTGTLVRTQGWQFENIAEPVCYTRTY